MTSRQERILGGLFGAAIGDAMGAVTETRPAYLIKEKWGFVDDLIEPPFDTFAKGQPAGQVTDDFSLAVVTIEEILKNGGIVTDEVAKNALLRWQKMFRFFDPYAGPTSKNAIYKLMGLYEDHSRDHLTCENSTGTNGGAMKAAPIGYLNGTDYDKTIEDVIIITKPTHNNPLAAAGAAAIACAAGKAVDDENATIDDIFEAGLYGAVNGRKRADEVCKPCAGPSMERRIQFAIELGLKYSYDFDKAMNAIADIIGTGLPAVEAVPAAFGMIAACGGDAVDSVLMGVNAGHDTDTVATMIGGIVGALHGYEAYSEEHRNKIEKVNGYDLTALALSIDAAKR